MDGFNEYAFRGWLTEKLRDGMTQAEVLAIPAHKLDDKLDQRVDNLSAWELVCYLGEYLSDEEV